MKFLSKYLIGILVLCGVCTSMLSPAMHAYAKSPDSQAVISHMSDESMDCCVSHSNQAEWVNNTTVGQSDGKTQKSCILNYSDSILVPCYTAILEDTNGPPFLEGERILKNVIKLE